MATENAEVKSACLSCSNNITHPRELIGETIACPHCGQETLLSGNASRPAAAPVPVKVPSTPAPARTAPAKSAPIPPLPDGSEAPQAFIERVRGRTCYRTLRRIIYFVTSLMFVMAILSLVPVVGFLFVPIPDLITLIGAILFLIVTSASWALGGFAFRELAGLLLDIADVLIEQNRRK